MDTSAIVRIAVSFLSGFVAAGSAAYMSGLDVKHALSAGLAGALTTSWAFIKESPLSSAGPAPKP